MCCCLLFCCAVFKPTADLMSQEFLTTSKFSCCECSGWAWLLCVGLDAGVVWCLLLAVWCFGFNVWRLVFDVNVCCQCLAFDVRCQCLVSMFNVWCFGYGLVFDVCLSNNYPTNAFPSISSILPNLRCVYLCAACANTMSSNQAFAYVVPMCSTLLCPVRWSNQSHPSCPCSSSTAVSDLAALIFVVS